MLRKNKKTKVKAQYRGTARMSSKQRTLRLIILYSIVVIAIISVCVALSLTVLFKVESIQVQGNNSYDNTEIIKESGISKYQNLYLCKKSTVTQNLTAKFPYIEDVNLERKIPNTIVIHVIEAKEAGTIENGESKILISSKNKVLDITDTAKEGVAVVRGVEVESAQIAQELKFQDTNKSSILKQLETAIKDNNLTNITAVDITDISNISFTYENRIVVNMGQAEGIEQKVAFTSKVINNSSELANNNGTLDVSMCLSDNKTYFVPDYN